MSDGSSGDVSKDWEGTTQPGLPALRTRIGSATGKWPTAALACLILIAGAVLILLGVAGEAPNTANFGFFTIILGAGLSCAWALNRRRPKNGSAFNIVTSAVFTGILIALSTFLNRGLGLIVAGCLLPVWAILSWRSAAKGETNDP